MDSSLTRVPDGAETAMRLLALNVFCGFFGLGVECFFIGAGDGVRRWSKSKHLWGQSSLWYFPLYALAPSICYLSQRWLFAQEMYVRGFVYAFVILALEYVGMAALQKLLGTSPSEKSYRSSRFNVDGRINLAFAPLWFWAGLLFEYVFCSAQGI